MIVVFIAFWLAGWVLVHRLRNREPGDRKSASLVPSIIVPARNEEQNLPKLLESLQGQGSSIHEIVVVDDGSTDGTASLAKQMGARVIAAKALPSGWKGKTWACHQGAHEADGEWLLFMDADTWFEPGGMGRIASIGHEGALSVLPYHRVKSMYEDLSLFFNIAMTAGTVPDGLAGQFLLIRRKDYDLAGGHESVQGNVLENFRLAEGLRKVGVAVRSVPGKGIVAFRMYPDGMRSLIEGWTKGFAAGAGGTPKGALFLVIAWMIGLMIAPLGGIISGDWLMWGVAYGLCVCQVIWLGRMIGSFGWLAMLAYPIPLMFFFGLFGWSAARSGRKVTWKGREIHAD